jgi:hypothetical protein
MSTKCTLAYGDGFHFYSECFDEDNVYLELSGPDVSFKTSPGCVTVVIPHVIFEVIREYQVVDMDLVDASDEDLERQVREYIDDRAKRVAEAKAAGNERQALLRASWDMPTYGSGDAPYETQLAEGLKNLMRKRAEQRRLKEAIEALRRKQRRQPNNEGAKTKVED